VVDYKGQHGFVVDYKGQHGFVLVLYIEIINCYVCNCDNKATRLLLI